MTVKPPSLTSRRYRRVLIASSVTLLISVSVLGLISFSQWRGRQALQGDTHSIIAHVGQQLLGRLQSRRGTLTFIRDTLNRSADLSTSQLEAMGSSAVEHTQHLIGIGLIRANQTPQWWVRPTQRSSAELAQLHQSILQRIRLRGIWRVPSTFVSMGEGPRPLLVMLEPLRASGYVQSAILGVFDLKPLLADFVAANVPPHHRVQLLDGETPLYRSEGWHTSAQSPSAIVVERPLQLDAARWRLQMQPGHTNVSNALSWLNVVLIGLSVIAGIGVILIVWLLAARTWILQRAVARRTAALRRTTERLRQMAVTDELTGLYNRRFFLNRWGWECARAKRYQRPLACLMIDVDGFKQVNDRLGHPAGDVVLQQVAQELKTLLRESDILARLGGDEFVIALPETTLEQAELVAEKLRQIRIALPEHPRHLEPVKLSVGIGQLDRLRQSPQAILKAADQSLYAFKHRVKHLVSSPVSSS